MLKHVSKKLEIIREEVDKLSRVQDKSLPVAMCFSDLSSSELDTGREIDVSPLGFTTVSSRLMSSQQGSSTQLPLSSDSSSRPSQLIGPGSGPSQVCLPSDLTTHPSQLPLSSDSSSRLSQLIGLGSGPSQVSLPSD